MTEARPKLFVLDTNVILHDAGCGVVVAGALGGLDPPIRAASEGALRRRGPVELVDTGALPRGGRDIGLDALCRLVTQTAAEIGPRVYFSSVRGSRLFSMARTIVRLTAELEEPNDELPIIVDGKPILPQALPRGRQTVQFEEKGSRPLDFSVRSLDVGT